MVFKETKFYKGTKKKKKKKLNLGKYGVEFENFWK